MVPDGTLNKFCCANTDWHANEHPRVATTKLPVRRHLRRWMLPLSVDNTLICMTNHTWIGLRDCFGEP